MTQLPFEMKFPLDFKNLLIYQIDEVTREPSLTI